MLVRFSKRAERSSNIRRKAAATQPREGTRSHLQSNAKISEETKIRVILSYYCRTSVRALRIKSKKSKIYLCKIACKTKENTQENKSQCYIKIRTMHEAEGQHA